MKAILLGRSRRFFRGGGTLWGDAADPTTDNPAGISSKDPFGQSAGLFGHRRFIPIGRCPCGVGRQGAALFVRGAFRALRHLFHFWV